MIYDIFDIFVCELSELCDPKDCDVTVVNVGLVLKPVMTSRRFLLTVRGVREIGRHERIKLYCSAFMYIYALWLYVLYGLVYGLVSLCKFSMMYFAVL